MKNSLLFLFIIVLIAKFTVPDNSKLRPYLEKKNKLTGICNPITAIRSQNYFVFSIQKVNYCSAVATGQQINDTIQNETSTRLKPLTMIQKTIRTDQYIGLFGTFWKLK